MQAGPELRHNVWRDVRSVVLLACLSMLLTDSAADKCSSEESDDIPFSDWLDAPGSWALVQSLLNTSSSSSSSCRTVKNASLMPPSLQSFGLPDFRSLPVSPVGSGQSLPLYLHGVIFQTNCTTVRLYQQFVCGTDPGRLAGAIEITSPYWIYIHSWQSDTIVSSNVNITCLPPTSAGTVGSSAAVQPPCLAASVSTAAELLDALDWLQRVQGPPEDQTLPVLIVLQQNITFTEALVAPYWPLGAVVSGNVTVAAVAEQVVLDWSGLLNVLNILPLPSAYLTLSRIVQVNLPYSFAPPVDDDAHVFGVLPSVAWSVHRKVAPPSQFALRSCTCVLSYDSFSFWAYFLSVATSPDPTVSRLVSWTDLRGLQDNSGVGNTLRVVNSVSPSVSWVNMTLANPDVYPVEVRNIGLVDITGSTNVPPTAMFQVASLSDVQYAVNYTIDNEWTQQYGQFIILCANMSGNASSPSLSPVRGNATAETSPPDMAGFSIGGTKLPPAPPPPPPAVMATSSTLTGSNLTLPAVLQAVTTFTVWPNVSACWDFQLAQYPVLENGPQTKVTMRDLSLMNLPPSSRAGAPGAAAFLSLVTGFWMFNIDMGDSTVMNSYLTLQDMTLYVPTAELQLYLAASSPPQPANASRDALRLSSSGRDQMAGWINRQQVAVSGDNWIYFKSLETLRFQGTNINLTDTVPPACADYQAMPFDVSYGAFTNEQDSDLLPAWAIGLIVGLSVGFFLKLVLVLYILRRYIRHKNKMAKQSLALAGAPVQVVIGGQAASTDSSMRHLAQVVPLQADADGLNESFSNAFRSYMVSNHSRLTSADRVNPESLLSRLETQNSNMRDEHLQISSVLGRGGHGVVYKGIWKSLPVAVKVMIVHEEEQEKAHSQMLEAMLSTSLSHPNIVTTYTYDLRRLKAVHSLMSQPSTAESSGSQRVLLNLASEDLLEACAWQLLIVQELCCGGPMRKAIDSESLTLERSLSGGSSGSTTPHIAHVLQLALDVAKGLEHLHAKNIVHSDLNPNNVLLQASMSPRAEGLKWIAKVADFGLSVTFEAGRSHVSRHFGGTPFYIAPETQSDGIISKQSDVFSFGILLSEMMSGSAKSSSRSATKHHLGPEPLGSDTPSPNAGVGLTGTACSSNCPACGAAVMGSAGVNSTSANALRRTASTETAAAASAAAAPLHGPTAAGGSDCAAAVPLHPTATVSSVDGATVAAGGQTSLSASVDHVVPTIELIVTPKQISPTSASCSAGGEERCSPLLMGGGGGKFGSARQLPPLPSSCPADYCQLVADCLNPRPQQRPCIGAVVQRLKALATDVIPHYEASIGSSSLVLSPGNSLLATLYEGLEP